MRQNDFLEPGTTNTVTLPETNISHPENGWFPRRSFPILGPFVTFQGRAVKLRGGVYTSWISTGGRGELFPIGASCPWNPGDTLPKTHRKPLKINGVAFGWNILKWGVGRPNFCKKKEATYFKRKQHDQGSRLPRLPLVIPSIPSV